jgi:predicted porin
MLVLNVVLPVLGGNVRAEDRIDELIQRLEQQDREIEALREEVKELREIVPPPPQHPEYRKEDGEEPLTEYVNPDLRLDVAGQVNPAMNVAGDGKSTKVYFVDNDTTASRLRFAGVGIFAEGPTVGTTLEIGLSPNNSSEVGQDDETAGDLISVRRAELWVRDDRLGRVMFGRGSAAADNTAEYDLTLVGGPIMMSGVSMIAGGLDFTTGHALTGVTIGDAFQNFDGSRQSRIRYDSPLLGPLQLSVSAGANQRYDAAITFGGDYDHWTGVEIGPFTTLGAVSIYDPNQDGVDFNMAGSWSMLHDESGLSLTLSSGFSNADHADPYNVYAKLGWDTRFFPFGQTGFGVDYTWSENVSADHDEGQSVGLAAIQVFDEYGIELYTQFRWYDLDRVAGPDFDAIFLGTLGSRVRF